MPSIKKYYATFEEGWYKRFYFDVYGYIGSYDMFRYNPKQLLDKCREKCLDINTPGYQDYDGRFPDTRAEDFSRLFAIFIVRNTLMTKANWPANPTFDELMELEDMTPLGPEIVKEIRALLK